MPETRRSFIKLFLSVSVSTIAAAAGILPASVRAAWPHEYFANVQLKEAVSLLFDDRKITETDKIKLKLPRIAENGAVVPITVTSKLEKVESISIFVEKNPVPLAARFSLSPEVDPFVSARLKMAETCDVIVLVEADGNVYSAKKQVKVTIGGCGG